MDQINWLDFCGYLGDVPQPKGMMSMCMSKDEEAGDD